MILLGYGIGMLLGALAFVVHDALTYRPLDVKLIKRTFERFYADLYERPP